MKYLLFIASFLLAPAVMAAGSAEKGKAAFVKHGCWQCHGYVGQGGVTGPRLAQTQMSVEAFSVFVRNTRGGMPPYQKPILSDADLADIHAYLQAVPKPPDYKSIPLLNP
jgi:ubiquinol-cytochrome c reductase cytochrome c subunit